MAKTKVCIGTCKKRLSLDRFGKHAFAKDGKNSRCSECWGKFISKKKKAKATKLAKALASRESESNGSNGKRRYTRRVDPEAVNGALAKANGGPPERYMVRADDGDAKEFRNEQKALKQAMLWKLDGHYVEIWRRCQFDFVLRIRG